MVDDFDVVRIVVSPDEANPPLLIDTDRMLAFPITLERFELVRGWHTQVVQTSRIVQKTQLAQRRRLNIRRKPAAAMT